MHNMGKFFIEMMVCDSGFLNYTPLQRAAAAFFASIKLQESPIHYWVKDDDCVIPVHVYTVFQPYNYCIQSFIYFVIVEGHGRTMWI